MMVMPSQRPRGPSKATSFPDRTVLDEMEQIGDPAILYLPGGVIAAVNGAASRLSDLQRVGQSMFDLARQSSSRLADGARLRPGDLPFARALRGEVVGQGERIDIVLANGTLYRALVTSSPVIRDGTVVGALSVWHDFERDVRRLTGNA